MVREISLPAHARGALAQGHQGKDQLRNQPLSGGIIQVIVSIGQVTQFELQIHLNRLAKEFSDSIVRHAFSNIKSIFRSARKMKFIVEDPAEDLLMPDTRAVKKPKIEPQMILDLIDSIPHPRDRALLAVGCFCGPRTSENLGLTWKSYGRRPFHCLRHRIRRVTIRREGENRRQPRSNPHSASHPALHRSVAAGLPGHLPGCPDVPNKRTSPE